MKVGRVLPPAAAPLGWRDLCHGAAGMLVRKRSVDRLQDELRRHFGVDHAFLVSSGTAALTVSLLALRDSSRRTEVVIPAYTCFSVPAAVVSAGLKPVLCDIDLVTLGLDPVRLERTVTDRTLCVVAHHLFGVPSDIARIGALCRTRGIAVVEDAAQAMGVRVNGRHLGTLGDIGVFSLGRGKNITCGHGGIILTDSPTLASALKRQVRLLRPLSAMEMAKDLAQAALLALFIRPRLYWLPAALPFLRLGQTVFPTQVPLRPLSGMHAGMLRHWRSTLQEANRRRSETAVDLSRRIGPSLAATVPGLPYLRLPVLTADRAERDSLLLASQKLGLGMSGAYPTTIDRIPELESADAGRRFPAAQHVADRLVTLPTHHLLSKRDRRAIAACVVAARHPVRLAV